MVLPRKQGLSTPGDSVDFETTWAGLSASLREIHTRNASKLSFEDLYRSAYQLVLKKKGAVLYERVTEFEKSWLRDEICTKIRSTISSSLLGVAAGSSTMTANEKRASGEKFLKGLKQAWEDHILSMNMTTDVLMYMDRVYCVDQRQPSIFTTAMGLFRENVLRARINPESQDDLTIAFLLHSIILEHIQMEREGDIVDKSLIRSCIYILEGLYETEREDENEKLYVTSFEPEFLEASRAFYHSEGERLLRDSDAGSFLRQAARRLIEEQDRCNSTISLLTAPKIKAVVEDELIQQHMEEIVEMNSGLNYMLDNDRFEDLKLMYELFARVDSKKEVLKRGMQKRVNARGEDVNKATIRSLAISTAQTNGDKVDGEPGAKAVGPATAANIQTAAAIKWVDEVLQLKDKYDAIWQNSFDSDQGLQTALTRSFADFINAFPRSPEYISLFIDENLKRGLKGKTENEVDAVLEKAITLLRYVQDKDLFERYYKKHLSRRLLMGRSVSGDVERQMISRMKMEVGNHFTQKLEGMFKDMTISEDLTAGFKTHIASLGQSKSQKSELGVHVLTSTFWPMESMGTSSGDDKQRKTCIFPPEIEKMKASFENFYLNKHTGRQLSWEPNMGTADMRATFPKASGKDLALGRERRHEINVSTYSMVILLLFNDVAPGEALTFEEIQAKTLIPENELMRNLQSLAVAPKTRILKKDPMSRDVKTTDRFLFNETFTSKFMKLKVGVVATGNKVEGDHERKETEKKNDEMRGGIIEAAIVRIMKQRKELAHQNLVTEVITQLSARFMPDVNMVKRRVESLIEREYLERVEDAARPAYRYLA
ncbi:MAG: thiamine metabolism- protein [Chaenotheca gracillima]|nr:MAG: thiamine metabolism- protein [Chaenotheca gracillima]